MSGAQRRQSNWTADEDRRLLELVEAGKSWVFSSANLKRPAKTVRDRLAYLRRQAKQADLDSGPVEPLLKAKEKLTVAGVVRYIELGGYGERTGRQLIAKADAELPAPADRANWQIDPSFDLGTELLDAPSFRSVLETVLKNGHEIIS